MYVCIHSTKLNKQRNKIKNEFTLMNGEEKLRVTVTVTFNLRLIH